MEQKLSEFVKTYRTLNALTLHKFEKVCKISYFTIWKIENKKLDKVLSPIVAHKLAKTFGLEPQDIMEMVKNDYGEKLHL